MKRPPSILRDGTSERNKKRSADYGGPRFLQVELVSAANAGLQG
jgi:hypothetical protein